MPLRSRRSSSSVDVRTGRTWPPSQTPENETKESRMQRLELEQDAKRVSESIDKEIEKDEDSRKQDAKATKILFLGQSESGKTTLLKNFRMQFSPKAFEAEVMAWMPIIQLNLVRSINFILDLLRPLTENVAERQPTSNTGPPSSKSPVPLLASEATLRRLQLSLGPLKNVEEYLAKRVASLPSPASTTRDQKNGLWKNIREGKMSKEGRRPSRDEMLDLQTRQIIDACADDMADFWVDPTVQATLTSRQIVLEEQPGFFLDNIKRIAALDYKPRPNDILRARMRTDGVEEHHLPIETSQDSGEKWIVYDVAGASTQRAAWASYFDCVSVLIFIAPISAFDQTLGEIPNTNRLADSFSLWEAICRNKILSTVQFILLLNKVDILHAKLGAGAQFGRYVTSYKDRPNDTKSITIYLSDKFAALHQHASLTKRRLHIHLTCAIDTMAMRHVVVEIRDVVLKKNLMQTNIL